MNFNTLVSKFKRQSNIRTNTDTINDIPSASTLLITNSQNPDSFIINHNNKNNDSSVPVINISNNNNDNYSVSNDKNNNNDDNTVINDEIEMTVFDNSENTNTENPKINVSRKHRLREKRRQATKICSTSNNMNNPSLNSNTGNIDSSKNNEFSSDNVG